MMLRTEVARHSGIIASYSVGRYIVQVFDFAEHRPEPVYQVLLDGRKIRCWTHADEHAFPKTPAMVGNAMVEAIKADRELRKGGAS